MMELVYVNNKSLAQPLEYHEVVNEAEAAIMAEPQTDMNLRHIFTPGLYTRELFIPAGTALISYVHKKAHPFTLSKGHMIVLDKTLEWLSVSAPFTGVSEAYTRRLGIAQTDCIWTTFIPTDIAPKDNTEEAFNEAVRLVEDELYMVYDNPLLKKLEETA